MTRPATLEVFEFGATQALVNTLGPSEEWQDGHANGFAEAQSMLGADSSRVREELLQAISDMSFGYAEAKAEILQSLSPLFEALIKTFVPDLARASLIPLIQDCLLAAATDAAQTPLVVCVPPQDVVALTDLLAMDGTLPFTAKSDPALAPGQALVSAGQAEQMIDLSAVLDAAQQTLAALLTPSSKGALNG